MFYKLITNGRFLTAVIIFILAVILWLPGFLSPSIISLNEATDYMPLYKLLGNIFEGDIIVSRLLAFSFMLFEAFLLVRINARFVLVQQRTFLPALFFIIITGHSPETMQMSPVIPASVFIIIILELIFQSYKDAPNSYVFFNLGLLLGLGTLFYSPLAYMLVFLWIANMVQRPFHWREYIFPVLGLAMPILVTMGILYLADSNSTNFVESFKSGFYFHLKYPEISPFLWIFWIYLAVLIFLASIFHLKVFQFRKVYIRDYYMVLFWLFITGSVMYILLTGFDEKISYLIGISISFMLTNYFINTRKSLFNKILLYLLMIYSIFMAALSLKASI